jgi:hypothetical protein
MFSLLFEICFTFLGLKNEVVVFEQFSKMQHIHEAKLVGES